ncbi:hypothetical protein OG225_38445 [Nocardia sp. NBC_01377]|uniref:hypothetical protein n=1 Tax=Nocardia sp. NBC_01377 TaxID=2903595 RepID=UPI003248433B
MADRIEVDPTALEKAAFVTDGLAKSVKGVADRLRQRLDAIEIPSTGQPWGNDKMGKTFVEGKNQDGYGPAKTNTFGGLAGIQTTLEKFATGQVDAAKTLRNAESGSTFNLTPGNNAHGGRRSGPPSSP